MDTVAFSTQPFTEAFGSVWTWFFLLFILVLVFWLAIYVRRLLKIKDQHKVKIKELETELESWHHDALTGILSRRMFMEQAKRLFGRVYRHLFEKDGMRRKTDSIPIGEDGKPRALALYGRELSIIFFDIDHFKRVNDTYGHDIGDRVLAKLGEIILSHLRHEDLAGRYGGEEFIIAISSDVFGAQAFLRRIRKDLSLTTFRAHDGTEFQVTLSGGVVQLTSDGQTLEKLIKQADELLYRAKGAGRNRYFMLEGEDAVAYER